jgi:hypothetical protein
MEFMKTVSSLTVSSHDFTAVVKEQLTRVQTFITDTLRVLETPTDVADVTTISLAAGVTSEKEIVKKRKSITAAPIPTQEQSTPTSRLTLDVTGTTEKATEVSFKSM